MIAVNEPHIVLVPVTVSRQDGTQEVVYMEKDANGKKGDWKSHLPVAYMIVGTLALTLTAVISFMTIKRMQNGQQ